MHKKTRISKFSSLLIVFFVLSALSSFVFGLSERIDGLVAVVNNEVITLTDIRIAKEFGLYDLKEGTSDKSLYQSVLENMISQKLVQQFTGSDVNINKKEVDRFIEDLERGFEESGWKGKLDIFGMTIADLRDYCARYLSYKKIITERFNRSVVVSLKEMEEYYDQVYVPEQEAKEEILEPMVDILPEIESAVKERKTKGLAEEWIENLESQAEIRIYLDKYMDFLQKK
jgi:hypothetical protein